VAALILSPRLEIRIALGAVREDPGQWGSSKYFAAILCDTYHKLDHPIILKTKLLPLPFFGFLVVSDLPTLVVLPARCMDVCRI
jgi:hypothetical protein